jgi:hypothetical protein
MWRSYLSSSFLFCSYNSLCSSHDHDCFNFVCLYRRLHHSHNLNLGDSITENLLRFVSKLLYKDGSGDPLYAPTYLREQGINNVPIMNYRGNSFNTIFHNAPLK